MLDTLSLSLPPKPQKLWQWGARAAGQEPPSRLWLWNLVEPSPASTAPLWARRTVPSLAVWLGGLPTPAQDPPCKDFSASLSLPPALPSWRAFLCFFLKETNCHGSPIPHGCGWMASAQMGKATLLGPCSRGQNSGGIQVILTPLCQGSGARPGLWAQVLIQKTSGFIAAGLAWQVLSIPS